LPSEGKGHTFESCRVRQFLFILQLYMRAQMKFQFCLIRTSKQSLEKIVAEFSQLFGSLNHRPLANLNAYGLSPSARSAFGATQTLTGKQNRLNRSKMDPKRNPDSQDFS
jgi:hypothetical protein